MGYESKVYVMDRHDLERCVVGIEIAVFDLCCMGYNQYSGKSFTELFTTPIDFDSYVSTGGDDYPNCYRIDCYGKVCTYTEDIDEVISWLEQAEEKEHYRRAKLFLNFLKTIRDSVDDFEELVLVHYGY